MGRTKQNDDLGKRGLAIVQGQAIADAWNEIAAAIVRANVGDRVDERKVA